MNIINFKEDFIMARTKQKVEEKDYEELIAKKNEIIGKLQNQQLSIKEKIKAEKAEKKKLEKDYETYKLQKDEEEKKAQAKELTELVINSGLSMDEIKVLIESKIQKTKDKDTEEK